MNCNTTHYRANSSSVPGDPTWTYYEIDPDINYIAHNPNFFTYLTDSRADIKVELGDARLSLNDARDGQYSLIVLDAYSSDAIPVHLLTREALQLYLRKLEPHGILAFHISNRYFRLEPVVGNLAQDSRLVCLNESDLKIDDVLKHRGKTESQWVIVARRKEDFGKLIKDPRWRTARTDAHIGVWTDDYSSVLSAFRWRGSLKAD